MIIPLEVAFDGCDDVNYVRYIDIDDDDDDDDGCVVVDDEDDDDEHVFVTTYLLI
jgi:hypothetical protein